MCTEAESTLPVCMAAQHTASERAAEHEKEAQESSKRDTKEVLIPAAPLFRKGCPLKEPEQSSMQPGSWLSSVHTYVHIYSSQYIYISISMRLYYSMESRTQNYVCAARTNEPQLPLCWVSLLARAALDSNFACFLRG